jgi:hypothetical protein
MGPTRIQPSGPFFTVGSDPRAASTLGGYKKGTEVNTCRVQPLIATERPEKKWA